MSLLLAAEAVVEARFARARYAMIADVMRANGAEEYKADFVEKELRRLSKSANISDESCKTSPVVSQPNPKSFGDDGLKFQKQLSECCAKQLSALAEVYRAEMHQTLESIRQESNSFGSAVIKTVRSTVS